MDRAKWVKVLLADLDFVAGPRMKRRVRDWLGRLLDATEMDAPPRGMTIMANVILGGGVAVQFDYGGRVVSIIVERPGLMQLGWMKAMSNKYGANVYTTDQAGKLKNALWWLIDGQSRGRPKFNQDEECYGSHRE